MNPTRKLAGAGSGNECRSNAVQRARDTMLSLVHGIVHSQVGGEKSNLRSKKEGERKGKGRYRMFTKPGTRLSLLKSSNTTLGKWHYPRLADGVMRPEFKSFIHSAFLQPFTGGLLSSGTA